MSGQDERKITPRYYQQTAIDKLKENEWQGILEMATVTGKTITSLLAAVNYYEKEGRIFIIIIVPFVHLVDQWAENIRAMNLAYPLKCYGLKKNWLYELSARIRDFNISVSNQECIITTYKTATSQKFIQLINKINTNSFLIADECHYFGISSLDKKYFLHISARVGLSATPDRWWDEEGTEKIYDYFAGVVFNYDLKKAIKNDFLVEYRYHPLIIGLTSEEIDQYKSLTKKIVYLNEKDNLTEDEEEKLKTLNLRRSWIISKAKNKKDVLYQKIFTRKDELSHTIIYCAPGEIDEIVKEVSSKRCLSSKLSHLIKNLFEYSHSNITIKSSAG
jgi:superfamily II DNA or RNA helicase